MCTVTPHWAHQVAARFPDGQLYANLSMAGVQLVQASAAARELSRSHLIDESAPGRLVLHDLLRAYAAELARAHELELDQLATVTRMLDHYLHTAHAAAVRFNPARLPLTLKPAAPGTAPESVTNQREAEGWFDSERLVLLALIAYAAHAGADRHAWQLAWALADFLQQRGHWPEWAAAAQLALAAAERARRSGGASPDLSLPGIRPGPASRVSEGAPSFRRGPAAIRQTRRRG